MDEHCTYYRLHSNTDKPAVQATPIRILFAICSPKTLGPDSRDPNLRSLEPLPVQLERRIIQQAMEPLVRNGLAVYEILDGDDAPVTFDLVKAELQNNWHVLHLLAHGGHFKLRGAPASQYLLVFENKDREHAYIAAEEFDTVMFNYDLRLVVLAACQSGNLNQDRAHEKGETFRALAPVLVDIGVGSERHVLAQGDAIVFKADVEHSYENLSDGESAMYLVMTYAVDVERGL